MTDWFDGTMVQMLHGEDFNNKKPTNLKSPNTAIILFFADWCGHCKNLKPEYIKFAEKAGFINVYAVDSDSNKNLLTRMSKQRDDPVNIRGYPTVWIYQDGKPWKEYTGAHTWQGLLQAAMHICSDGKCKYIPEKK